MDAKRASEGRRSFASATREVLILVFGILVAFGLDAWWDRQVDRNRETEILTALATEFAEAETQIDTVGGLHANYVTRMGRIAAAQSATDGRRVVSLPDTAALWIFTFMTLDVPSGVLESVVASGEIGLVQNRALRAHLAAWPTIVADAVEEEHLVRELVYSEIMPQLAGLSDLIRAPIPDVYDAARTSGPELVPFPTDERSRNLVAARIRLERIIGGDFATMSARLDSIQALIEGALGR